MCPRDVARRPGAQDVTWSQRPDTRGLLNLKSGELRLASAERLLAEALSTVTPQALLSYPYQGDLLVRLAALWGVPEESMALTAGSTSAISALVEAHAVPAGRLVLQEPAFPAWRDQALLSGVPVVSCPGVTGTPPRATWAALTRAMDGPPAVLVLTNPGNPLGELLPRDEVARLARRAEERGHLLVVDECYGEFAGADHLSLLADHPHLVVVRSLSKVWAMAGARLAVVFAHPDIAAYLQKFFLSAPVSGTALAVARALADQPDRLSAIWSELAEVRAWFVAELARRHPTWTCLPSVTNFVTVSTGETGGGAEVARRLADDGVRVRALDDLDGFEGCWRIAMTDRPDLERVLDLLDAPPSDVALDLSTGVRADAPFPHVVFAPGTVLAPALTDELVATFPEELIPATRSRTVADAVREGQDKTYSVAHLGLYRDGVWNVDPEVLPPAWQDFLRRVTAPAYAEQVLELLGLPPQPVGLEVRLTSYPSGGWMSRHTDRADKLFSHNFYLCPDWRREYAGGLALYADETDPVPHHVVLPDRGNAVLFRRSEDSWHEVLPVAEGSPVPRRAVLVHGYVTDQGVQR